jgi:PPIC-type PPIASE domain/Carboxypeptidase regulatory-like domain
MKFRTVLQRGSNASNIRQLDSHSFLVYRQYVSTGPTRKFQLDGHNSPEQVCLSEILISTSPSDTPNQLAAAKKKAEQVRDAARSGASFAGLAARNSEGPSAAQGGTIGCFKRGQLAKPIEELVFGMKFGDVSDVLPLKSGFAILQVTGDPPQPGPAELLRPSAPSGRDSGVRGTIVDSERSPIANAYVITHRDGEMDMHARTDSEGKYVIPLAQGVYDVFISADGFSPTSRKINVGADGMMIYDAVLEINSLGVQAN